MITIVLLSYLESNGECGHNKYGIFGCEIMPRMFLEEKIDILYNLILYTIKFLVLLSVDIQRRPHSATLFEVYVMLIITFKEQESEIHGMIRE